MSPEQEVRVKEQEVRIAEDAIRYLRSTHRNPDKTVISVGGEKSTVTILIEDLWGLTPRGKIYTQTHLQRRCGVAVGGKLWGSGFTTREEIEAINWAENGRRDAKDGVYQHRPNDKYFQYYLEGYREYQGRHKAPKRFRGKAKFIK